MADHAPTDEQIAILDAATGSSTNLILNALAGCIAAGTLISIRRGNDLTVRKRPIERLLQLRKPEIPTLVLSDVDGVAQYQPMIGCMFSGYKATKRLETTFGEVIATPDHEIKTENGWKALACINPGEWVFTREHIQRGRAVGRVSIYSVQHHPYAYQHNIGEYGNYGRIARARLVIEAKMNNLTLEEIILIVRHNPYKAATLSYLAPELEVHHINEDPTDDRFENLVVLNWKEHRQIHKMHSQHARLGISKVISVTDAGWRGTYDIAMPAPYHNFLANGHVVHNCGKTSTLEMIERAVKTKPILYLVFNTRNAKEAEKRMLSTTTVRTFNSLGHRIWAKSTGRNLSVDPKKCGEILRSLIRESPKHVQSTMWEVYWEVLGGVGMAKALGYLPEGKFTNASRLITQEQFHASLEERPDGLVSGLIDAVLVASIKAAFEGAIDYNDQLYMPALFGGAFPQFPLVTVDETQDLSPIQHAMLHRLVRGRIIAVGDPWQNIYAFRGAKQGGMAALAEKYDMRSLNLSISFRCPQAIVENARWRVPHFKWIKPGGYVERLEELSVDSIPDACTFLCRNNAPLFRLAMHLLSAGRSVSVAGSDVGPKLIGIMRRLGEDGDNRQRVLTAIADWQAEREAKESKTAADLAECMRVFASHGATLGQAIAYAEHLFKQEGTIRLSTGHKAKGLEWPTVYHLDPWLIREDDEQDLNLHYVIQTRSQDRFFEIESRQIKFNERL